MLEHILDYEKHAFLWMNSGHSAFFDQFMWLFSGKIAWIPLVVVFIVALSYKNKRHWKELLLIFIAIIIVITLCDQFASSLCKPFFSRLRPTHHPDFMDRVNIVFDYRGGLYGFISSHAANSFGFVTLTSLFFRNKLYSIMMFIWAIINSYSRIYLGVHFISDIVPGIITGIFFGWIVYKLFVILKPKYINYSFQFAGINIVCYTLLLTIVVMTIISLLYSLNVIPALTVK